jgi:hypothetical protein
LLVSGTAQASSFAEQSGSLDRENAGDNNSQNIGQFQLEKSSGPIKHTFKQIAWHNALLGVWLFAIWGGMRPGGGDGLRHRRIGALLCWIEAPTDRSNCPKVFSIRQEIRLQCPRRGDE